MRLVPTLAAAALLAPAAAVEFSDGPLQGLGISGFGEAYAQAESRDANNPRNLSGSREDSLDFPSDALLALRYRRDEATLQVDVQAFSKPHFGSNTLLEQCFIDWAFTPELTLRAGRFRSEWLAWEGFHTPDLFRVNHSAAWDWNVQNHGLGPARPFVSDGVGLRWRSPDGKLLAEGYVVDDVLGVAPGRKSDQKAVGGALSWDEGARFHAKLGIAYDPNSVNTGSTTSGADALAVELNAGMTVAPDWFVAGEVQIHRHPDLVIAGIRYGNDLVALAMVNWAFDPGRWSATLMVDYVERGFAAADNEVFEIAVALLHRPRAHVQLNLEVFSWQETRSNADSIGAAGVILVKLP